MSIRTMILTSALVAAASSTGLRRSQEALSWGKKNAEKVFEPQLDAPNP